MGSKDICLLFPMVGGHYLVHRSTHSQITTDIPCGHCSNQCRGDPVSIFNAA